MATNKSQDASFKQALPRYLCDKHLADTALNPGKACINWARIIISGNRAFNTDNLELANQYFGAACEIARILIRNKTSYPGQLYAADRLLISSHNLSVTLAQQNRHPQAGELLIHMHRELMVICNDEALPADNRALAYSCLQPSLERLRPFLERMKDQTKAEELVTLTTDICWVGKTKICH